MKFIKDISFNIFAQTIFIVVLQIILFPTFEKKIGSNDFGLFLVIYGIFNVVSVTISTSFTNLYQRNFSEFKNEIKSRNHYTFYYKKLIIYLMILILITIPFFIISNYLDYYILVILLISLTVSRLYLVVIYRVQKKFGNILIINGFLSTLYVLCYILNLNSIFNILFSFVIIELIMNILVLLIVKVSLFKVLKMDKYNFSYKQINIFIISGLAASLMNYSDRFIINILIDSVSVTIYFIATLPAKLMLFPFNMISSVILSYIADTERISKNLKRKVLVLLPIIFIIVVISTYFLGILVIKILYNNYLDDIKTIYIITTITFGLICIDFIIRSFLLKYFSIGKKAYIDIGTLLLFFLLSFIFGLIENSLISIAIAQFIVFLFKVFIEVVIFTKLNSNKEIIVSKKGD
ncbi:polysaccharide biosynthesis protein [Mammaliicoccus sciuri]|uniref:hypothetical protein n=1 Tax=Mammaliicoccus sciuri TaxID=1296 RepID=UPI001C1DD994|nr:hypothetical protein [Mammaliicoccus sciuri]MBU6087729.1 hypothetical protein [Mammaliicoccus sciuri]MBW3108709.1 hypothetical protein [Mammaliicoccus sciuri]WQL17164.1 hypothetical protein P3U34_12310 [Mammaliicoccus sciuri]